MYYGGRDLGKVSKISKVFQTSRIAQKWSQKSLNMFWTGFEVIFQVNSIAQCTMGGHDLEKFHKNRKRLKIPKLPEKVPKLLKHVLNMFWGNFSGKFYCSVY